MVLAIGGIHVQQNFGQQQMKVKFFSVTLRFALRLQFHDSLELPLQLLRLLLCQRQNIVIGKRPEQKAIQQVHVRSGKGIDVRRFKKGHVTAVFSIRLARAEMMQIHVVEQQKGVFLHKICLLYTSRCV